MHIFVYAEYRYSRPINKKVMTLGAFREGNQPVEERHFTAYHFAPFDF